MLTVVRAAAYLFQKSTAASIQEEWNLWRAAVLFFESVGLSDCCPKKLW